MAKTATKTEFGKMHAAGSERKLTTRPDTVDFRDLMYVPTLVEVQPVKSIAEFKSKFKKLGLSVLDQGVEGACTGFGLAAVANFLLATRDVQPDNRQVSPRMLYEMAKRYDEWPGERYSGSSARGAMQGWHKHGLCAEDLWHYEAKKDDHVLTDLRSKEAKDRPLGAYFRVNHKDLVAMHAAITEADILYATATVHSGWSDPEDGIIKQSKQIIGGHAFAIVAYDHDGFWIQNSWGESWGKDGFARVSYDDWLENGNDVWVARLGVPVSLTSVGEATSHSAAARHFEGYAFSDLRPHVISIGNDGFPLEKGTYSNSVDEIRQIFRTSFGNITSTWTKKRLLIFAHGGLVGAQSAIQRVAEYRSALLKHEVYPISLVWHSDFWTTIGNILVEQLRRRRPEGVLDGMRDFMMDRIDDTLEPISRPLGKASWDEMKENALYATTKAKGALNVVIDELEKLVADNPNIEIHIVGHSAGSIMLAPFAQKLATKGEIKSGPMANSTGRNIPISSCTLWAPACTMDLFVKAYQPLLEVKEGGIQNFGLFTLDDHTEQEDDCAKVYNKSLLYLVAHAFEEQERVPNDPELDDGTPLLGMEKFVRQYIATLFNGNHGKEIDWILCPNNEPLGSSKASKAKHHGQFDDEEATVRAVLARILKRKESAPPTPMFQKTSTNLADRRKQVFSKICD